MAWQAKDGTWMTRVDVVSQEQYDGGPFDFGASYEDGTLDRVLASLVAIRESIPEEHRAAARCAIESVSGYEGSSYANIDVSYDRPATDEEIAAVVAAQKAAEVARRDAELATLAALQRKYASS